MLLEIGVVLVSFGLVLVVLLVVLGWWLIGLDGKVGVV